MKVSAILLIFGLLISLVSVAKRSEPMDLAPLFIVNSNSSFFY